VSATKNNNSKGQLGSGVPAFLEQEQPLRAFCQLASSFHLAESSKHLLWLKSLWRSATKRRSNTVDLLRSNRNKGDKSNLELSPHQQALKICSGAIL
jgi:hypothetical protein